MAKETKVKEKKKNLYLSYAIVHLQCSETASAHLTHPEAVAS